MKNSTRMPRQTRKATHNSTYKKLAVQWLNEALCSVSSFVVADSFVLRNRQLLVAANRSGKCLRHSPERSSGQPLRGWPPALPRTMAKRH